MWVVFKINKNKSSLFFQDLEKKIGKDFNVYSPKILIDHFLGNKIKKKKFLLLGDYIFCFHKKFEEKNFYSFIKYCRGLKLMIPGCIYVQPEINRFIEICKKFENENGFLTTDFFNLQINKNYKILSGPFLGQVVKILDKQKKKINLILGNIKTSINIKKVLFKPV